MLLYGVNGKGGGGNAGELVLQGFKGQRPLPQLFFHPKTNEVLLIVPSSEIESFDHQAAGLIGFELFQKLLPDSAITIGGE
jgi:hypothetical protein